MGKLEPVVGGRKKCLSCGYSKLLSGFNTDPKTGAAASSCKKCMHAKRMSRLEAEREEEAERNRRWPFGERVPCVRCFEMKMKEGGLCGCGKQHGSGAGVVAPAAAD